MSDEMETNLSVEHSNYLVGYTRAIQSSKEILKNIRERAGSFENQKLLDDALTELDLMRKNAEETAEQVFAATPWKDPSL